MPHKTPHSGSVEKPKTFDQSTNLILLFFWFAGPAVVTSNLLIVQRPREFTYWTYFLDNGSNLFHRIRIAWRCPKTILYALPKRTKKEKCLMNTCLSGMAKKMLNGYAEKILDYVQCPFFILWDGCGC